MKNSQTKTYNANKRDNTDENNEDIIAVIIRTSRVSGRIWYYLRFMDATVNVPVKYVSILRRAAQ
jgi:hypothetical protein